MGKTIGNEMEGAGTVTAALRRDLEEILGRVPTDQEIAAERGIPTEVGTALEQISLRERIRQEFQKARRHADAAQCRPLKRQLHPTTNEHGPGQGHHRRLHMRREP